jgi:hypothetical protein
MDTWVQVSTLQLYTANATGHIPVEEADTHEPSYYKSAH